MKNKFLLVIICLLIIPAVFALYNKYSASSCNPASWGATCSNAYINDNVRASAFVFNNQQRSATWSGFNMTIPTNTTIDAVQLLIEYREINLTTKLYVDTGSSASFPLQTYHEVVGTTSDQTYTIDVTDNQAWTPEILNSPSFSVNGTCVGVTQAGACEIDHLRTIVFYH